MMRILGIDPGLRTTGYGAIARTPAGLRLIEAGVITPRVDRPLEARLGTLHVELAAVIAATAPDAIVIEELWSAYKNPATAVLMGHARGVLCLCAHEHGIPLRHLAHSLVKRTIAGSGAARKEQVNRMVMQQLHLKIAPRPNDVSDALALALAFAHIEETERRFAAVATGRALRAL
jgi:crossover junction endodeoxyribonuclease RuvC